MQKLEIKNLIRNFLKDHQIGVISTVTENGNPEAAVIGFAETDNLELIFETFSTYRKYKNIKSNNKIAFVIGWDENITVQYEGEAHELKVEEKEKYKEIYFTKRPIAKKWENKLEIRYFKVIPRWIRYSNLNAKPWEVLEVNF